MLTIDVPGLGLLSLEHLVLDYNGTLAVDGHLLEGIAAQLETLADVLTVHVVTGNTHGDAAERLKGLPVEVSCIAPTGQAVAKHQYVTRLGAERVVAIGNGNNDALMLDAAALGIAVLGTEGLSVAALNTANIVVHHGIDALGLLLHPKRLIASLRR